ncbi:MAG: ATP-binding cassette domain-containing protein, partial [Pseudanabaena sp.]
MSIAPILKAENISKSFGGIHAVNNARIEIPVGSITGLIGPNGAGKTTFFGLLSNFLRPD